jgi:hypothetical protein
VVDAEGKVVSYSMAGGSGSAALDRATLEMIRRAGTVPKPPPELLNNGTIEVVALAGPPLRLLFLSQIGKSDNVRLSIAAAMLGPQLHGRTL